MDEKFENSIKTIREKREKLAFLGGQEEEYDRSIEVGDRKKKKKKKKKGGDDGLLPYEQEDRQTVIRREMESYHAPQSVLSSLPRKQEDKEILESKFNQKETVAAREDEYRSRWRKRALEPMGDYDPFSGTGDKSKSLSYSEIMQEQNYKREEGDVLQKIQKKQEQDRERERQEKVRNEIKEKEQEEERKTKKLKKEETQDRSEKWLIKVYKNEKLIQEIPIEANRTLTLGRDPQRNQVVLEHQSCSSVHARIEFDARDKRPLLIDLNSTNQTFLNEKSIKPNQEEPLYRGDVLRFGASTREYVINKV